MFGMAQWRPAVAVRLLATPRPEFSRAAVLLPRRKKTAAEWVLIFVHVTVAMSVQKKSQFDAFRSFRVCSHGRTASRGDGEIVNPLFANPVRSLDQFASRFDAVLNDDDHSSVELALRFVDAGKALAFGGYDVLNGYLGSVRLENRVLVGVFASGNQVAENEKIGHFSGRNQAHEIEVEIGPSGGGHVVVVVELRVGPVEVVLPDAASHDRRFGWPLIRECHAGLQTPRPMRGTEGNCFAAHPCRNESRPAVAH